MTPSRPVVRTGRTLAMVALVAGAGLLAYSGLQGDLSVHLVVVLPVVSGSTPAAAIGMLLTVGGLFGVLLTRLPVQGPGPGPGGGPQAPPPTADQGSGQGTEPRSERRSGGIILIGPIPIAWGSGKQGLRWAVLLGVVLTVLAVGLWWYLAQATV